MPFFIVTHRPEDAPADAGFTFVDGLDEAIAKAREAAGDKDVHVMGGADVIRQALRAGHVEELSISVAPVVLGAGKRLFDDFDEPLTTGAPGRAPVAVRHPHHLPGGSLTGTLHAVTTRYNRLCSWFSPTSYLEDVIRWQSLASVQAQRRRDGRLLPTEAFRNGYPRLDPRERLTTGLRRVLNVIVDAGGG